MDDRRTPTPYPPASSGAPRFPQQRGRKHMGVASNDPEYLPPVNNPYARTLANKTPIPQGQVHISDSGPGLHVRTRPNPQGNGRPGQVNRSRYLSTPKRSKSIFASQASRQQRRAQILLATLIVLALALALVWWFFLR